MGVAFIHIYTIASLPGAWSTEETLNLEFQRSLRVEFNTLPLAEADARTVGGSGLLVACWFW